MTPASPRLPLVFSMLMVLIGWWMWSVMPRQEDPSMPDRWAALVVHYPGATPEEIESTLAVPIERALQRVDHVHDIESCSRTDVLVLTIELDDDVYDVETHWQRVREAIATVDTPDGAHLEPLDTRLTRQESMVIAVTGGDDLVVLSEAAFELQQQLLKIPQISEIRTTGLVEPEIAVTLDPGMVESTGLDAVDVREALAARTGALGIGSVSTGSFQVGVRLHEKVETIEEIRAIELVGRDGQLVTLGELATVERRGPAELREQVRQDGAAAVLHR